MLRPDELPLLALSLRSAKAGFVANSGLSVSAGEIEGKRHDDPTYQIACDPIAL